MDLTFPLPAEKLLPHKLPMCCIDSLVDVTDTTALGTVFLREGHILVDENGHINPIGYIELAAQTAGAMQGYAQLREKQLPSEGFLVAVQHITFSASAFIGEDLWIQVQTIGEFQGISVLSFCVYNDAEEKSCGKLKVYQPRTGS